MDTIAAALTAAVDLAAEGRGRLRASPRLQSWPGIVHGGGMAALFDAVTSRLATAAAPRIVEARLTSSVPTDVALSLDARTGDDGITRLTVLQGEQTLTSAAVSAGGPIDTAGDARWAGGDEGALLPGTDQCLACGALNPLGLGARLRWDERGVWARIDPPAPWLDADGRGHPALGPVLLDEIAWWLGALVMQEGGLTNRIRVTLIEPHAPPATSLVAAGRFDAVAPVDRGRSFWRTETVLLTTGGRLLATASIVFRGGPEYSARQMDYFRRRASPDLFRRMFPRYAETG